MENKKIPQNEKLEDLEKPLSDEEQKNTAGGMSLTYQLDQSINLDTIESDSVELKLDIYGDSKQIKIGDIMLDGSNDLKI